MMRMGPIQPPPYKQTHTLLPTQYSCSGKTAIKAAQPRYVFSLRTHKKTFFLETEDTFITSNTIYQNITLNEYGK